MSAAVPLRGVSRAHARQRHSGAHAPHSIGSADNATALLAILILLLLPACGRKTPVRPAEFVAPAPITNLAATSVAKGVALSWQRPKQSADGQYLLDLDGFVVERALPGLPFAFLTRVQVPDRDKLRQQKRFTFVDESALMGEAYRYRVLSATMDGYFSTPSNVVDIVRQAPAATPTAAPSPAR